MAIKVARTLGPLGAEIEGVDVGGPLEAGTIAAIRQAWLEHLVLVFRGQALDDAALVAFSGRFGRLEKAPIAEKAVGVVHVPRLPEVTVVSNVVEGGVPLGSLGDGELSWHSCVATDSGSNSVPRHGGIHAKRLNRKRSSSIESSAAVCDPPSVVF